MSIVLIFNSLTRSQLIIITVVCAAGICGIFAKHPPLIETETLSISGLIEELENLVTAQQLRSVGSDSYIAL